MHINIYTWRCVYILGDMYIYIHVYHIITLISFHVFLTLLVRPFLFLMIGIPYIHNLTYFTSIYIYICMHTYICIFASSTLLLYISCYNLHSIKNIWNILCTIFKLFNFELRECTNQYIENIHFLNSKFSQNNTHILICIYSLHHEK